MADSLLSLKHLSDDPDHPLSSWPSIAPDPRGRLVLLTPEICAAAAVSEIKTGKRFSLDYAVYPSERALYGRLKTVHSFVPHQKETKAEVEAKKAQGDKDAFYNPTFDDLLHLNTQGSTQWDYFLHYSYPNSGLFYGGLNAEQVTLESTGDIGIAAVAKAGGVQTRALFIDIPYYLSANNMPPLDPFSLPSSTTIDLDFLKTALKFFNLTPEVGDVLIVRTGFESRYAEDLERVAKGEPSQFAKWSGVKACKEVAEWIWQTGFVAVGSDNPTFEEWKNPNGSFELHPVLLSGMGIMIGELLRLNEVAEECKRLKRWSFFLSSNPLMIEHGVASPPNAVAIF